MVKCLENYLVKKYFILNSYKQIENLLYFKKLLCTLIISFFHCILTNKLVNLVILT